MKILAKSLRCGLLGVLIFAAGREARAAEGESWQSAVSRMPLIRPVSELNRSNILDVLLHSFGSNATVKALIFMPGATDEWFMPKASKASITNVNPSLLDAINALTNQSRLRVTYRPPFLLLHSDVDQLEPVIKIEDQETAEKIRKTHFVPHAVFFDNDWDHIEPSLKKSLKTTMRPWRYTRDSWHFYRHSLSAWNLTGWEALEATALAGRTFCTIERKKVVFQVDHRLPPPEKSKRPPDGAF